MVEGQESRILGPLDIEVAENSNDYLGPLNESFIRKSQEVSQDNSSLTIFGGLRSLRSQEGTREVS